MPKKTSPEQYRNYIGDRDIAHGGTFYNLSRWPEVEYIHVYDLRDTDVRWATETISEEGNYLVAHNAQYADPIDAIVVQRGLLNIEGQEDDLPSALEFCGIQRAELDAMPDQRRLWIADALRSHSGSWGESDQWIITAASAPKPAPDYYRWTHGMIPVHRLKTSETFFTRIREKMLRGYK